MSLSPALSSTPYPSALSLPLSLSFSFSLPPSLSLSLSLSPSLSLSLSLFLFLFLSFTSLSISFPTARPLSLSFLLPLPLPHSVPLPPFPLSPLKRQEIIVDEKRVQREEGKKDRKIPLITPLRCLNMATRSGGARCCECGLRTNLVGCLDCDNVFCDGGTGAHLHSHLLANPSHQKLYSFKTRRQV